MEYKKKINLSKPTIIPHHIGGWNYVLKILYKFHCSDGIFTDDIADMTFGNNYEFNTSNKIIPYKQPWIGFFHHPLNIVPWYLKNFQLKPYIMIASDEFKQSQKKCRGIFTFSKSMANWYKEHMPNIKIDYLYHPTIMTDKKFDLETFVNNPKPLILNIGFFLRRLTSIYFLKCDQYEKVMLVNPLVFDNLYKEMIYFKYDLDFSKVRFKNFVSSEDYDKLLSHNIVFLDLYDSCANNVIIECIARNTPILVNKQESVSEYLGEKYPLYYSSIDEASAKLSNKSLIIDTHHYLSELDTKNKITGEYFSESFYNSEIYNNL